jgi:hypothetical protein
MKLFSDLTISLAEGTMSLSLSSDDFACKECGTRYSNQRHLNVHEREHCTRSKRGLSTLLDQAKEAWNARKRRKIEQKRQANAQVVVPELTSSEPVAPEGIGIYEPLPAPPSSTEASDQVRSATNTIYANLTCSQVGPSHCSQEKQTHTQGTIEVPGRCWI